jgi:hypothetical protein
MRAAAIRANGAQENVSATPASGDVRKNRRIQIQGGGPN